ncbi:hypothetical protein [Eisenibacter elegans]|uniref:hypothetical protein n=1 Tax=Eisenibacter elegans TaxID=997 RepID=UPI0003F70795|nr:hypothetical protein [Eisenibacter elegans]
MAHTATFKDYVFATLGVLLLLGGMMFVVLFLMDNLSKKRYQLEEVYYLEQAGQPVFLLQYSNFTSGRGGSTNHNYIHRLDPQAEPKLARRHLHLSSRSWSNSNIHLGYTQGDTLFVFRLGDRNRERIFLVSLQDPSRRIGSEQQLIQALTQKYPELNPCLKWDIGEDNNLYWTTETGQIYRISLSDWSVQPHNKEVYNRSSAPKLLKTAKHHLANPVLGERVRLMGGPQETLYIEPPSQNRNRIEISIETFDEANRPSAKQKNQSESAQNQALSQIVFLKGALLKPFRYDSPANEPYQSMVFVAHQNNLNQDKSALMVSKINIDKGEELYRVNVSEAAGLEKLHKVERSLLFGNQLFLFVQGNSELNFLCLNAQNGQLLWRERLAYGGSLRIRAR